MSAGSNPVSEVPVRRIATPFPPTVMTISQRWHTRLGKDPAHSSARRARAHAVWKLHRRVHMDDAPTLPSRPLDEPDRPTEPRCARCGDRLEGARTDGRSTSRRQVCVDCATGDVCSWSGICS
jgi:hypothetical protein